MLNKLRALVKAGNTFCGYLSGLGILVMSLILAYEVVMRGIFKAPTIWVMNTAIYLFMWTMLAGAAYTLMLGKHVRIDLIFDKFPKRISCLHKFSIITSEDLTSAKTPVIPTNKHIANRNCFLII